MTKSIQQQVLELLPAFYLERDARSDDNPGFLQGLLTVIAQQLSIVDADLDQLYDDLFIETCDSWVIPYIGDLVAVLPGAPVGSDAVLTRGAVANAIALRRRKGTIAVLEQLALDISEWPAVAVELFQRTSVTQQLGNVVPTRGATVDIRQPLPLERLDGAFDSTAHTLEVGRIGSGRGRYNVQNVAVFVWRDRVLNHTAVEAAKVDAQRWRFSPLGADGPLAVRPDTEVGLTHRAAPSNVPGELTRRAMAAAVADFYGPDLTVQVSRPDGTPIDVTHVVVCDLSDSAPAGALWSNVSRLSAGQVAIDPQLGRLAFGSAQIAAPLTSFVTTAPSDTGGSETGGRPEKTADMPLTPVRADGGGGVASSIAAGITAAGGVGIVEVRDSRTYLGDLAATVPTGASFRLVSAEGALPVIELDEQWVITIGEGSVVSLIGLIVTGGPLVLRGRPEKVEITDCTFVPGGRLGSDALVDPPVGPSVILDVDRDWQTTLALDNCITGPVYVPADGGTLSVSDSIIDGVDDGLGRTAGMGAGARIVPVLRGPDPLGALALPAGSTTLRLILGTDEPRLVDLGALPTDAISAAGLLDTALTGSGARAIAADDRIVVIGDGRPLSVIAVPGSTIADALGLTSSRARMTAVRGGLVDVSAAAAGGSIAVTVGNGEAQLAQIAAAAANLTAIAAVVQTGLRAVGGDLTNATVGALDGGLLVVPGEDAAITFAGTSADLTTASLLAVTTPRPAIAADAAGAAAPLLNLERSTVFGDISVTAVKLVTDSIVTGSLRCQRQQTGCVQYSWISPNSITPRQHRCQPTSAAIPQPAFVSRHFATPGYGRLRRAGASAVIRGASTGFEMGALARLQQTQRDDNLRRAIAEFLRFGLEAGVLDGN